MTDASASHLTISRCPSVVRVVLQTSATIKRTWSLRNSAKFCYYSVQHNILLSQAFRLPVYLRSRLVRFLLQYPVWTGLHVDVLVSCLLLITCLLSLSNTLSILEPRHVWARFGNLVSNKYLTQLWTWRWASNVVIRLCQRKLGVSTMDM